MAKEKEKDIQEEPQQEKGGKKTLAGGYLQWIIIAVVAVFCAGAGFGLGRLFGGPPVAAPVEAGAEQTDTQSLREGSTSDSQSDSDGWYYDFEPVVANLNEPGITRYIRVALTLQISAQLDPKKGTALLQEKNPLLKNWLTIYLASQSLEDIRGDRNLRRIQSEILDAFNEKLFPNAKGKVRNVLFKEFAVQ